MRVEGYKLCLSLAEAAPNLAAPASPVPLEALVALCVRGLDDECCAARLAAAAATGAALSAGVEGSTAENERLGVIAARDQARKCDGTKAKAKVDVHQLLPRFLALYESDFTAHRRRELELHS